MVASAKTVFNFCSGPAMLPAAVMHEAQDEFVNYHGLGVSIMEMSHRSPTFLSVLAQAEENLRQLLSIPSNYRVLFLQGGASAQFSAIPLNLAQPGSVAGYIDTGYWSQKAIDEARRYTDVQVIASNADDMSQGVCAEDYSVDQSLAYLHYTANETIDGIQFDHIPECGRVPLICDMSSCILSEPLDVTRFGLIYAGAQKNIGPAGLTVVIVRDDLLGFASQLTPKLLNYQVLAENHSMANTPPSYGIYLANLVFRWLLNQGGLAEMQAQNRDKAQILYQAIDASQLFYNYVHPGVRSQMNVPFFMEDHSQLERFLQEAENLGFLNLKGHRSRGGLRASIYNAMPREGVLALVQFLEKFENSYAR